MKRYRIQHRNTTSPSRFVLEIDAEQGRGCSHCATGTAMSWFETRGQMVALCIRCLHDWFPQLTIPELEARLGRFMNHPRFRMAENRSYGEKADKPSVVVAGRGYPVWDAETGRWWVRTRPGGGEE